jgi:hypothetical protein
VWCDFVYAGTSCASQPCSSQDAVVADLDLGHVLEFKTTVDPTGGHERRSGPEDRVNLQVEIEGTNTANPGRSQTSAR